MNGKGITPRLRRILPCGGRISYSGGGELFAKMANEEGEAEGRLYPVCGNVFRRVGRLASIEFSENSYTLDGAVCNKL